MKPSLESALTAYFIELFRNHPGLRGKTIRPHESSQPIKANCLVIEVNEGESLQEGPRGPGLELRRAAEVMVKYRSTTDQNDVVKEAITAAILAAGSTPTKAQAVFGRLDIYDERMTTERSDTDSLRIHTLKIPVEAGYVG